MAWSSSDIPDQTGRVVVVTGANGGLGLATARELARHGAHVVMAVRDLDKAEQARRSILQVVPGAEVEIVALDLCSLASVRKAAALIIASHRIVDILVNNAGVMALPERRTEDGFEVQFGTNHLGHFVLTAGLLPAVVGAPSGRVVTLTSFARIFARPVDLTDPHLDGRYDPWRAYGQSKLANDHFGIALHRRLAAAGSSVRSVTANPGLAHTDLQVRADEETGTSVTRFWRIAAGRVGMSPAAAAMAPLRAATDPEAPGGALYGPLFGTTGPTVLRFRARTPSDKTLDRLWSLSERETGERFDVAAIVAAHR